LRPQNEHPSGLLAATLLAAVALARTVLAVPPRCRETGWVTAMFMLSLVRYAATFPRHRQMPVLPAPHPIATTCRPSAGPCLQPRRRCRHEQPDVHANALATPFGWPRRKSRPPRPAAPPGMPSEGLHPA